MNDWTGNKQTAFVCNGASNHSIEERETNDFYATEPKAVELLLAQEQFNTDIWECACGAGHMSKVLIEHGYNVKSSDIIDRGFENTEIIDFLKVGTMEKPMDIITNPPYKYAAEFVEHALELQRRGGRVAMFLKLTFLEGKARKKFFEKYPPKVLYVSSARLQCAKNGDFEKYGKGVGTAIAYGWYIWEKGFTGEPVIRWI